MSWCLAAGCSEQPADGGSAPIEDATSTSGAFTTSSTATSSPPTSSSPAESSSGATEASSESSGDGSADSTTGDGSSGSASTGATLDIPDPGDELDILCFDEEPNDHPNDAVPCGIVVDNFGSAALYVAGSATIGDGDLLDYYVIETDSDVTELGQFAEWFDNPVNLLDFTLFEVDPDGTSMTEVFVSEETSTTSERSFGGPTIMVTPSTRYLIEIRSVEGAGQYRL